MTQQQARPRDIRRSHTLSWPATAAWVIVMLLTWQVSWAPIGANELLSDWAITGGMFDVEPALSGVGGLLGGAISGAIAGVAQWWLLRHLLPPDTRWRLRTIIGYGTAYSLGWLLAFLLLSWLRYHYGPPYTALPDALVTAITVTVAGVSSTVIGLVIGLVQWFPLRAATPRAAFWPLATTLAWLTAAVVYWLLYLNLGGPVCQLIDCEFNPPSPAYYTASTVAWVVAGLVVGTATALTMKYVLTPRR